MAQHARIQNPPAAASSSAAPGTPENPLHTVKTLPNLVTLLRLIGTLAFVFMYPHESLRAASLVIFTLAACTDWLDGQLARHLHQVSVFGKRFDPVMDRLLIFSGILSLFLTHQVPTWVVVFLIARDCLLAVGALVLLRTCNVVLDVCYVGKACTFVLMSGFAVVLFGLFPVPGLDLVDSLALPGWGAAPTSLGMWAIYVGCVLSLVAASVYVGRGVRALRTHRASTAPEV